MFTIKFFLKSNVNCFFLSTHYNNNNINDTNNNAFNLFFWVLYRGSSSSCWNKQLYELPARRPAELSVPCSRQSRLYSRCRSARSGGELAGESADSMPLQRKTTVFSKLTVIIGYLVNVCLTWHWHLKQTYIHIYLFVENFIPKVFQRCNTPTNVKIFINITGWKQTIVKQHVPWSHVLLQIIDGFCPASVLLTTNTVNHTYSPVSSRHALYEASMKRPLAVVIKLLIDWVAEWRTDGCLVQRLVSCNSFSSWCDIFSTPSRAVSVPPPSTLLYKYSHVWSVWFELTDCGILDAVSMLLFRVDWFI